MEDKGFSLKANLRKIYDKEVAFYGNEKSQSRDSEIDLFELRVFIYKAISFKKSSIIESQKFDKDNELKQGCTLLFENEQLEDGIVEYLEIFEKVRDLES